MRLNRTKSLFGRSPVLAVLITLQFLALHRAGAQCTGPSGTITVGPTGTHATLTAAIAALNTSTGISGSVVLELQSAYTSAGETFPITFPANTCLSPTRTITVRPASGASGLSISSANATATIDLNGARYVTIDGRPGGTGTTSQLTIANSATGAAVALRLINDASNNTITYCRLTGSATTSGVVLFSTGTATGNDNNTLSNNAISATGSGQPLNGIYSLGSSATVDNSGNTVTGNNISDYFNAATATDGILLGAGNSAWTISSNRLFQTASRQYTTGNTHTGINITSGSGYSITGNTIGYANASGTGTTNLIGSSAAPSGFPGSYTTAGTANATRYAGISCAFTAGGTTSSIQGNTIAGFALYTSASTTTATGIFCGIAVTSGPVNIGTTTGNTIGAASGTGSIYTAATATGGIIAGIYVSSGNAVAIRNNTIGALDAMGTTASVSGGINGINTAGPSSSYDVSGNTIGNATSPNLRMGNLTDASGNLSNTGANFGIATGTAQFNGILSTQTGAGTIGTSALPNIIRNAALNSSATGASIRGITASGIPVITGNLIHGISSETTSTGLASTLLAGMGIFLNSISTAGAVVTGNTIHSLALTNTTTSGTNITAIALYANSTEVSRNRIYNITNASTSTSTTAPGTASGIFLRQPAGVQRIFNNMISLGNAQSTNTAFVGIWMQNSAVAYTMNCYFNTINIEGSVSSGSQPSFCFHRGSYGAATVVTPVDIRNNVFVNTRTGSASSHYAIGNCYGATAVATGWGANASNYNVLNAASTTVGYWTGDQTFGGWQTASASDANSASGVTVTFVSTSTGDLHLNLGTTATRLESGGTPIGGITSDFDNQTRPGPSGSVNGGACAPDLGADEFDGVILDVAAPVISFTALPNTSCVSTGRVLAPVTMTDCSNINTTTGTRPRLYYRKSGDANTYAGNTSSDNGWKYVEASNTSSPFSFTIDYSLLRSPVVATDVIEYFIVAQDIAATPNVGFSHGTPAAAPGSVALTAAAFPVTGAVNSYTILSGSLSGAVTVGATGTYASLTGTSGLFSAINTQGLAGHLTATIIDASITETGAVALNSISATGCAAGPYNVLIRPQASLAVTLTGNAGNPLIKLNGADRVTIDGINSGGSSMKIINTNAAGSVVWFASASATDGAENDTLRNCSIAGASTSGSIACFIAGGGGALGAAADAPNNNNTVSGNTFTAAQNGIYIAGQPTVYDQGWLIDGNTFGSTTAADKLGFRGLSVQAVNDFTISNNIVNGVVTASTSTATGISTFVTSTNGRIFNNRISDIKNTNTTGYGSNGIALSGTANAANITVYNNFISDVASYGFSGHAVADNGYGIVLVSGGGYNIYYNTVLMNTNQTSTTGAPAAINITSGIVLPASLNIRNNIFASTQTVGADRYAALANVPSNVFADLNYNNYSSPGSANLAYFNGNRATLTSWQVATGKDFQSDSAAPVFVAPAAPADLHLSTAPGANWCLNGKGIAIAGITTDIDGQPRNSPPDIGADEFTATDNSTAAPAAQTVCSGSPVAIALSGAAATYRWTRDNTTAVTGLPANGTGSISGALTNTTTAPVTVTFTVTPVNAGDCSFAPFTATVLVNPRPNAVAAPASQAICSGSSITAITLSGSVPGSVFDWTRDNTTAVTGIANSGTGNISGALSTTTTSPALVTFTVTPTYTNASTTCSGTPVSATVTVNTANAAILTSAAGTDAQTVCITKPITNITYSIIAASSVTVTGLPAGVSGVWAANVLTISGTPTVTGTFSYTVNLTGGCGAPVSVTGSITIQPNNTITLSSGAGSNVQTRCINTPVTSITYATTGATGATFSGLPTGVTGSWAGNVATISGTPTATGTFNYTVTLTGGCATVTATGTITVTPNNTISLSSAPATLLQSVCVSTAIANITYATTGATGATFSGLPAGVTGSWAGNVATISGTPTAAGTFNYTVTLTGGCGTITASAAIVVVNSSTVSLSSTAGTAAQTLCINTPAANITYTTSGATGAAVSGLPAGMSSSWAANVLTITGTPTASGSFSYTVSPTGGCGTATATGTINVTPDNTATLSSGAGSNAQTRCISTPIASITYATTGATGATFSGLPAGVSGAWASNVATISGSPSVTGSFSYTMTLTGGCGIATATGTITVTPANTISLSSAAGTNAQTRCINTAIASITYASTGATGATFSGLPAGVTGSWAGNVATISGTPTASGTFNYTVTLTGGCGGVTAGGSIVVTPANTISLSSATGTNAQTRCINNAIANITYATTGATGATFSGLPTGVTGSWSGNVATISGTPSVSGAFSYTVNLTGGCGTITAGGTINVNPQPTIAITPAAAAVICAGNSITLGASGASTYAWSPATGLSATTGSSVVASPAATTTYSITGTDANGCVRTVTKQVTVNNLPTVSITPNAPIVICEGLSATLNAAGAATYSWSPATGLSSTTGSPVTASPTVTTTYTVTGTATNGCTNTATKTVTVLPAPDAAITPAGYIDICEGDTVHFTAKPGYTSYVWMLYGGPYQSGASNTSSTFTGGFYTLRVIDANGCTATTGSPSVITIANNPTPVITQVGGSLETSAGYGSYQWYRDGVVVPGATGRSYTPTAGGTYTVTVTGATVPHCPGSSTAFVFTGLGVSGGNVADAIRLYPNPSNEVVHIDAPVKVAVTVSSMDGKELYTGRDVRQFNIGALPDGVYRVTITNLKGDYLRTDKITKVTR